MTGFVDRMIRAAKLDASLYEEVETDREAIGQAIGVVALSSIAAGIGSVGEAGVGGLVLATLAALTGWFIWAVLIYLIGTRVLPGARTQTDLGELLRTIGFSSSPGLLQVLGILPGLGGVIFFVAALWTLIAMVVAVKQALDYDSTARAVGVCAIGWVIQVVIVVLLLSLLSPPPAAVAEEPPATSAPSDFPEGSSSVIESLTWRVTGSDPAALRAQAKVLAGQVSGAVIVKEGEGLLIVSLPTKELAALRQELTKLGSVSAAEAESPPSAPTTLLRLTFVRP
ncbi:MAG: YIP1 family protein [Candidatus Binatia bacterium]